MPQIWIKRYERGTCRCKWRSLHACRECQIPTWSQKILRELCCKRVLLHLFNWHSVFREEWEILQEYKNLSLVTIVSFTGDSLYSQLEKERWKRTSCHREVCEPKSPKSIHSQNAKRERWPTWGIRANPSNPWSPPSHHRTTKLQACSCHNRKNNDNRQILIELHLRSDQFFQLWSHLLKDKVASGLVVCLIHHFFWLFNFEDSLPCPADTGGDTTQRGSGRGQTWPDPGLSQPLPAPLQCPWGGEMVGERGDAAIGTS